MPGHLATVDDQAELDALTSWLTEIGSEQVWLGELNVNGHWVSQTGPRSGRTTQVFPRNRQFDGMCASLNQAQLSPQDCSERSSYVIEFEAEKTLRFKNHFYRLLKTALTWGNAVTAVSTQFYAGFEGHIVTIETPQGTTPDYASTHILVRE